LHRRFEGCNPARATALQSIIRSRSAQLRHTGEDAANRAFQRWYRFKDAFSRLMPVETRGWQTA
jgi:hypothetical protein